MLRSTGQREFRQEEMRLRQEALEREAASDLLNLTEAAELLRVSRRTITRLIRHEPGVLVIHTPGSRRPIYRIPRVVIDRLKERMANR